MLPQLLKRYTCPAQHTNSLTAPANLSKHVTTHKQTVANGNINCRNHRQPELSVRQHSEQPLRINKTKLNSKQRKIEKDRFDNEKSRGASAMAGPKWALFEAHQIPQLYREPGVHSGYRNPRLSLARCFRSVLRVHNETGNIWTHLLPMLFFAHQFVCLLLGLLHQHREQQQQWRNQGQQPSVTQSASSALSSVEAAATSLNQSGPTAAATADDVTSQLPYLIYLLSITLCLFGSAAAHTFSSMSSRTRHVAFLFDYTTVSVSSLGIAIATHAYSLPISWYNDDNTNDATTTAGVGWGVWIRTHYLALAAFCSLCGLCLSGVTRFFPASLARNFARLIALGSNWLVVTFPILIRLCSTASLPLSSTDSQSYDDSQSGGAGDLFWTGQFFTSILSGLFYTSHVPELCWPGRFDLIGHSHQWFHALSASSFLLLMCALHADRLERADWLRAHGHWPIPLEHSVYPFVGVMAAAALVLTVLIGLIFALIPLDNNNTTCRHHHNGVDNPAGPIKSQQMPPPSSSTVTSSSDASKSRKATQPVTEESSTNQNQDESIIITEDVKKRQ